MVALGTRGVCAAQLDEINMSNGLRILSRDVDRRGRLNLAVTVIAVAFNGLLETCWTARRNGHLSGEKILPILVAIISAWRYNGRQDDFIVLGRAHVAAKHVGALPSFVH
jgi:hypothetical protein